ncbi:hypothetical protein [Hydrogenophaga sp. BPS33]|uniref:hypothetical protein n=1 Tax=Hydrogenophaga sp. BPS33 TaxID=2651974 RepID=UPI00131FB9EA|nr:hypothetical protein [Hydrogenophaga sp. BPS33]QHE84409.1 hypothetical protein F9K07_05660 [Hydrogenophaga sp. BPS33]
MIDANRPATPNAGPAYASTASNDDGNVQALNQKISLVFLAKDIETSLKHLSHRAAYIADFQQRIADAQRTLEAGTPSAQTLARIDGLVIEVRKLLESERTQGPDLVDRANNLRATLTELSQWKHQLPIWGNNVGECLKMLDIPPLTAGTLLMLEECVESAKDELRRVRAR